MPRQCTGERRAPIAWGWTKKDGRQANARAKGVLRSRRTTGMKSAGKGRRRARGRMERIRFARLQPGIDRGHEECRRLRGRKRQRIRRGRHDVRRSGAAERAMPAAVRRRRGRLARFARIRIHRIAVANLCREHGIHVWMPRCVNVSNAGNQQLQADDQRRQPSKTALLATGDGRTGRAGRGETHAKHRNKQRLFLSMRWTTRRRNFIDKVSSTLLQIVS